VEKSRLLDAVVVKTTVYQKNRFIGKYEDHLPSVAIMLRI
jgi:hypothetical protein